ncbi:hypothetical protein AB0D08_09270 [Kitasatospora sp. NPDC048540]|uniref:hypothetical protein n=1 Tax=unclassified Kitasatospora TaxID=2633591 RepID=UPI00053B5796|nr:hypothetical protein [Kitasatospora sp. MBT63]
MGRAAGGAVLCLAACGLAGQSAHAAESTDAPSTAPEPAAAQLIPPATGSVGGSAGLYAVGGGLVVAAGGAATWLRRRRAGRPTTF